MFMPVAKAAAFLLLHRKVVYIRRFATAKMTKGQESLRRSGKRPVATVTRSRRVANKLAKKSTSEKGGEGGTTNDGDQTGGDVPWYRQMFTRGDEQYDEYMATEWGFETRGDRNLFEKISLEGAQSGLSWLTILRKREAYRRVFHDFDIDKVAAMTEKDVERILRSEDDDPKRNVIVRHRGKIESTINNAKCIQEMRRAANDADRETTGIFDEFLWGFVGDKPVLNYWNPKFSNAVSKSSESEKMSQGLKKLGFRFVGPTTCYAMMQSTGMVIDHPVGSPQWKAARERLRSRPGGFQDRPSS